ncbi:MAG: hypothetical protein HY445_00515 [Candidatus Niyogibacteria bacterium]|nr:hypothetical protein [Candidatus Niyogibacteria bacterium]
MVYGSLLFNDAVPSASAATAPATPALGGAPACYPPTTRLSWPGVIGASDYHIYRCNGSACTPTTQITVTANTYYHDAGVVNGTTYRYRARSHNHSSNLFSGYSNIITSTPLCAPKYPRNLSALGAYSPTRVNLSWLSSTDATEYHIYRCSGVCIPTSQIGVTASAAYTDININNGNTYTYGVKSHNHSTNLFSYASIVTIFIPSTTFTPPTPSLSGGPICSPTSAKIAWTISNSTGVDDYHIYRCAGSGCTPTVQIAVSKATYYQDESVVNKTTYRYKIMAHNHMNNRFSGYSGTVTITPSCVLLSAPGNFSAASYCNPPNRYVYVQWDSVYGAKYYLLTECQGTKCTSSTPTVVATVKGTDYFKLKNASSPTTWSYTVTAYNGSPSSRSKGISITVPVYPCTTKTTPPGVSLDKFHSQSSLFVQSNFWLNTLANILKISVLEDTSSRK